MEVRRIKAIKKRGEQNGNRVKVKMVKNKVSPPFKEAEFDLMFGQGASKSGCLIDYAVKGDIIQKSGAWFNYGDIKIGQGRENAKKFIEENRDIYNEIDAKVRAMFIECKDEEAADISE